jgi:hypothetical protein
MAERPKPPRAFKTWIEWCIGSIEYGTSTYHRNELRAFARAELEELREQARLAGKCLGCETLLHIRCPDCAGVREPP